MTRLPTACPKPRPRAPKARKEIARTQFPARESEKARERRLAKRADPSTSGISGKNRKSIAAKRKRTAAQERAKHEREYGPPGFVDWIHAQPSVASGKGPCVAAHVGNEGAGTSRKADWTQLVPLTDYEHRIELHNMGRETFEAKYGISFEQQILRTQQRYAAHVEALDG